MLERIIDRVAPPQAERKPTRSMWHGVSLVDDFAWLRAANWQEVMRDPGKLDPAIRAYLEAENRYADHVLADTVGLQEALFAEMKGRIKEDDSSVPAPDGPYAYSLRYRQGGQHPVICRQDRAGGAEAILLDGDELAHGKPYFHLGATRHAPDHHLLAWSADEAGAEFYTIRIRDLKSGVDLADIVPDAGGSVVWTNDASAFYYVRLDRNHRPSRVFRHRLGTPVEDDLLVYEETAPGYFVSIAAGQSRRFAEISIHDHETSECRLLDLDDADAAPTLVTPREKSVQYDSEHHPALFGQPALVLRTNVDGAEDFKIVWTPLANTARENWRDLVPHRPGIYLLSYVLLADWLIRLEREEGLPRIVIRHLESGQEHAIGFDEEAYSLGVDGGYEFATNLIRFTYSSMTTPAEIWDYDLSTQARTLRKRQEVPSGHDPSAYVTRRLFAPSADGEMVPISLLHRKDLPRDGSAPCLLYGYGAYGLSMPAAFSTNRLSLVERGFIFAIAHVRGGTDKGWRWYREGKLAKKHNTFADFTAVAEYLVAQRWTEAERIVAQGGSAGGMLVGAVANMRPDAFGAIIAEVPFVDVLNTMLDDTLPLTPPEWPEWGNPIADAEAFRRIASYSPYENVRPQKYPNMLVLTGVSDPRVTYWEPAKWVARLRHLETDGSLLVFRTNMEAGHAGAAGRFDRLKEVALTYAFAIKVTRTNGDRVASRE
ncbi:MAG: S9 family peptidase [Xanthobacteraceae bacterium]